MEFEIEGRKIGDGHPPYIIAELSCNHNNNLQRGLKIIEEAKKSGVDAIKLQTYTADTITFNSPREEFKINGGLWDGRTLYDLYDEAHTPWNWHKYFFAKAKELGLTCFSSPFDFTSVDFLEENFSPPAYKIASFEMIDIPLIKKVASLGKPLFISTGMSSDSEIEDAVKAAKDEGCKDILLFHCISGYPTVIEDSNLKLIQKLRKNYNVLSGLSDHTLTTITSVSATALGASAIEKHFIIDRSEGGLDAEFSIEPKEMKTLVNDCANVFKSLGSNDRKIRPSEISSIGKRRSLYVVKNIIKGEVFTSENIQSIRPENGLKPKHYYDILGRVSSRDINAGTPLVWHLIE